MKRILIAILLVSLMTGLPVSQTKALQFDKSEYAGRRSTLMEKFHDGLIILQGAASLPNYYAFMQNNNFLYLTGVEIENAYLVIDPINKESILFADRAEDSGFGKVMRPRELKDYLAKRFEEVKTFYTCFQPEELARECSGEKSGSLYFTMVKNVWDTRLTREMQFVENLKSKYPGVTVKDCSAYIHEMRTIKSPVEIDLMRKAAKIAVQAHIDVMKATRPGVKEQEIAALFEYACKKEGADELAYYTIICTAENHMDLHHHGYERTLADGDFLVVDAGPDLHNYDIDITISYPANGKFTPRQREIYEACNAVHEACMQTYRPGLTPQQCNMEVREILIKKGFNPDSELMKKFGGGFGHYVGMAVHDVGGGPSVLKPGMVFANEPLAVFAKEKLGVRIEDTVVITETGCENLTAGLPRTVTEIESLMKR
ncbi:MAG: aminopeptidase P family protein [Porphyromonadaceae bacterium]|nr:MAG: aminopeptidase P family protein [Porphyromonadaceae bacterium]